MNGQSVTFNATTVPTTNPAGVLVNGRQYEVQVLSPTTLKLLSRHNLTDGQFVTFTATGVPTTNPAGVLVNGQQYQVQVLGLGTVRLVSPSISGLVAGQRYVVTSLTVNTLKLSPAGGIITTTDIANDQVSFTVPHNLVTGQLVTYTNTGGTAIGGLVSGQIYQVSVVSPTTIKLIAPDVITTASPHGFVTNQIVKYTNSGGVAIAGLTSGLNYTAIVLSPTTLKLSGVPQEVIQSVDPATDQIVFTDPHNLENGEVVTYAPSGAVVGGLSSTGTPSYRVFVVDATTIRLYQSTPIDILSTPAPTPVDTLRGIIDISSNVAGGNIKDGVTGDIVQLTTTQQSLTDTFADGLLVATVGAADPDTSVISTTSPHGFVTGERVVYTASTTTDAINNGAGINIGGVDFTLDSTTDIFTSAAAHGFANGQVLTFTAATAPTTNPPGLLSAGPIQVQVQVVSPTQVKILNRIGGLVSGQTYVVDVVSNTTFQLSNTGGLISSANVASDVLTSSLANGLVNGQIITYTNTGGTPIGGLVSGNQYQVIIPAGLGANQFLLASLTAVPILQTTAGTDVIRAALAHGFTNNQQVLYVNSNGTVIGGLANNTIYKVGFPNASQTTDLRLFTTTVDPTAVIDVTSQGSTPDTIGAVVASSIDATQDFITTNGPHGFTPGQTITYNVVGTPITGLTPGFNYQAVPVGTAIPGAPFDGTAFQLFRAIDLSSAGSGTQTITPLNGAAASTIASVDVNTDIVTTTAPHGLVMGQLVNYTRSGGTTDIGGVTSTVNLNTYAVAVLSPTTFKFVQNQAINLTNIGSATNTLTPATPSINSLTYNNTTGVISTATPHGFSTGQSVTFTTTGGLDSLVANSQYIVQVIDSLNFKLTPIADVTSFTVATGTANTLTGATTAITATAYDTTTGLITAANHGFVTGQVVTFTGGTLDSLVSGTQYTVQVVSSTQFKVTPFVDVTTTTAGVTLDGGAGPITFDANANDTWTVTAANTPHNFTAGQMVTLAGTIPPASPALVSGQQYQVQILSSNSLKLVQSIAVSGTPSGTNTLTAVNGTGTSTISNVAIANNILTLTAAHNFVNGQLVTFTGGTVTGLTSGQVYQVQVLTGSTTTIKLAGVATGGSALSGTTTFTPSPVVITAANTATDLITTASVTNFTEGQVITYTTVGTGVGGLVSGQAYRVQFVSPTTLKLNPFIDLTSSGDGTRSFNGVNVLSVNTGTDVITTSGPHSFVNGQQVTYTRTGGTTDIGGLISGQVYQVSVLSTTTFRLIGVVTGGVANGTGTNTFTAAPIAITAVDTTNEIITTAQNTGFFDGQVITYTNTGGVVIGGLTSGTQYRVQVVGPNTIKLTQISPFIDLTGALPAGSNTLTPNGGTGAVIASFNAATDIITTQLNHGFTDGQLVTYNNFVAGTGAGTAIGGLVLLRQYRVRVLSATTLQLYSPRVDIQGALTNNATNFSIFKTGIGIKSVDTATEIITLSAPHGLVSGQTVVYLPGTLPNGGATGVLTGLNANGASPSNSYQAIVIDETRLQLMQTAAGGLDNITAVGTRPDTFNDVPVSFVDISGGIITTGVAHGFSNGQTVTYVQGTLNNAVRINSSLFGPVSPNTTTPTNANVQVLVLDSTRFQLFQQIDLTSVGTGTNLLGLVNIANVDTVNDIITTSSVHGFNNGQIIQYNNVGGTAIGGLTSGQNYVVVVLSPTTVKLAIPNSINLSAGVGTNTITPLGGASITVSDVDTTNEIITTLSAVALTPGNFVTYTNTGGVAIPGLVSGTVYQALPLNAPTNTQFKLTPAINLGSAGSGTQNLNAALIASVDTSANTITTAAPHGFSNGTVVTYTSTNPISGLVSTGQYLVRVIDPTTVQLYSPSVNLTAQGAGTFAPVGGGSSADVLTTNVNTEVITTTAPHGFTTGQLVTYLQGGAIIGGLTPNQIYQVLVRSATTFVLSAIVDLTTSSGAGSGTNTLVPLLSGAAATISAIDTTSDIITTSAAHGFADGQLITYRSTGGASVPGLTAGQEYRVQVLSSTTLKLYKFVADIAAPIDMLGTPLAGAPRLTSANGTIVTLSGIDPNNDVVTTSAPHGFNNGQIVTYDNLKVLDATSNGAGITLNGTAFTLDNTTDIFTSASNHAFVTGQLVTFNSTALPTTNPTLQLVNGQTYQVVVLSPTTVQLLVFQTVDTTAAGTAVTLNGTAFTVTPADDIFTINSGTHGFTNGQFVTLAATTLPTTTPANALVNNGLYQVQVLNTTQVRLVAGIPTQNPTSRLISGQQYRISVLTPTTLQFTSVIDLASAGTAPQLLAPPLGGTPATISAVDQTNDIVTTQFAHGFNTGDVVTYTTAGAITGLTANQRYSVIVLSPNTLKLMNWGTPADTLYGGFKTIDLSLGSLNAGVNSIDIETFDVATDIVTTLKPHGFATGQFVTYSNPGGTAINGLVDGTTYQVQVLSATMARLTARVDITGTGGANGQQQILIGSNSQVAIASFDPSTEIVTTATAHGLLTNEFVTYAATTPITGLPVGQYMVQVLTPTTFKVTRAVSLTGAVLAGSQTVTAAGGTARTISAIDTTTGVLTTSATHSFVTGQMVTYSAGASIMDLTSTGTAVTLTPAGGAAVSFGTVNTGTDQLSTGGPLHNFVEGQVVTFNATTAPTTSPAGQLTAGVSQQVQVHVVNTTTVTLIPVIGPMFSNQQAMVAVMSPTTFRFVANIDLTGPFPGGTQTLTPVGGGAAININAINTTSGTETLTTSTSHGFVTGQLVTYNQALPASFIDITAVGAGTFTIGGISFPSASVSTAGDTFATGGPNHNFTEGQIVTFAATATPPTTNPAGQIPTNAAQLVQVHVVNATTIQLFAVIGGLFANQVYQVQNVGATTLKLTAVNDLSGALPAAPQTITATATVSAIDTAGDILTTSTNHGFAQGQVITYSVPVGTAIAPLTNNSQFFARVLSPTTLQVYSGFAAISGTPSAGNNTLTPIDQVVSVDTTNDILTTATNHGIPANNTVVTYNNQGGTAIGGLVSPNTQYLAQIISPNTFKVSATINSYTSGGTGTQTLGAATISSVATNTGVITTTAAHGFTNGQVVAYTSTGTAATPLVSGQSYEVQVLSANTLKIVPNITISGTGTPIGVDSFDTFNVVSYVPATGIITTAANTFVNGQVVTYNNVGGTPIGGLTPGQRYQVQFLSATTFKLTQAVDLTSAGTGFNSFTLPPLTIANAAIAGNTLNTTAAHFLTTGQMVLYTGAGTLVTGLTTGTVYEVSVPAGNPTGLQFFGIGTGFVDLVAPSGARTLSTAGQAPISTINTVDPLTNIITTTTSHGYLDGQLVNYATTGTQIGGLVNGGQYYVKVIDNSTLQLQTEYTIPIMSVDVGNDVVTLAANHGINSSQFGSFLYQNTTGAGVITATQALTHGNGILGVVVSPNQLRLATATQTAFGSRAIGGMFTTYNVTLADPQTATGTYSYIVSPGINDRIRDANKGGPTGRIGNTGDQNANGLTDDAGAVDITTSSTYTNGTQTLSPLTGATVNITNSTAASDLMTVSVALTDGQLVTYGGSNSAANPIGGLTPGGQYRVIGTGTQIQLTAVFDIYTVPQSQGGNASFIAPGVADPANFTHDSLPLSIPGPHIVTTSVPGQAASSDNLVLNTSANAIDITFDRDMNASTFTAPDTLGGFTISTADSASNTITLAVDSNFTQGQVVTYLAGSPTPIGGLQSGVLYQVKVLSPRVVQLFPVVDLQPPAGAGSTIGAVADLTTATIAGTDVLTPAGGGSPVIIFSSDATTNILTTSAPHGLSNGQPVTYTNSGGTPIGGLINGQTYAVVALSLNTLQLVPIVDLTSAVLNGTDTLQGGGLPVVISSVDPVTDIITTLTPHNFNNGQTVIYANSGGSAIAGLIAGQNYQVVTIGTGLDGTHVRLVPVQQFVIQSVDVTADQITFVTAHNFKNGDSVVFTQTGTSVGNVFSGTVYRVFVVSSKVIKLYSSTPINLTSGSFPADILRMTGPAGDISGPFTVTPLSARVFRVGFPTQILSGSYTIQLGSNIVSANGTSATDLTSVGFGVQTITTNSPSIPIPVPTGVDLTNDIITTTNPHGLVNNEFVDYTDTAVDLTSAGTGTSTITGSTTAISLTAYTATAGNGSITATNHGLVTGQIVTFNVGTLDTLVIGTQYVVQVVNANTIKVTPIEDITADAVGVTLNGISFSATAATDILTTTAGGAHNFTAGQMVTLGGTIPTASPALATGQLYQVQIISPTQVKLNPSFDLTGALPAGTHKLNSAVIQSFNAATDIITTTGAHGFSQGQIVTYTASGSVITNLINGQAYQVQVISANSLKLTAIATGGSAISGSPTITPAPVAINTVDTVNDIVTGASIHNFTSGQFVSYNGAAIDLTSTGAGVTLNGISFPTVTIATDILDTGGPVHGFTNGQLVTFNATTVPTTSPAGVLVALQQYQVQVVNATQVRLVNPVGGLVTGQNYEVQVLSPTAFKLINPIGGLVSGTQYLAQVLSPNSFRLVNTMDLVAAGTGTQTLQALSGGAAIGIASVNAATDVITTSSNHGFVSGQVVTYTGSTTAITTNPAGLLATANQYQVQVLTANTLKIIRPVDIINNTLTGINTLNSAVITTLNSTNSIELITTAAPHGFDNGQIVTYTNTGGTDIAGLVTGQQYAVAVVSPTTLKLTGFVDLTGFGTGTNTVTPSTLVITKVDIDNDTVTTAGAHGLTVGQNVVYNATVSPADGLNNGQTYQAVVVDANTLQLASGDLIDSNLNAGLDFLFDTATSGTATVDFVNNTPVAIGDLNTTKIVTSTINIPSNQGFTLEHPTLTLNINYAQDPDLIITLTAPDGRQIRLAKNVGSNTPNHANFTNTTFDDLATTTIQNGAAPFFGRFIPQGDPANGLPLFLDNLNGMNATGTWTLTIETTAAGNVGTLANWTLRFLKPLPSTGLGEPVADQSSLSFRIFNLDPDQAQSHDVWTAVGGASNGTTPATNFDGGRIAGVAVDPSDPSGNTVYAAGSTGGLWKTTNFLNPSGAPTWIPLTDFGATTAINVGDILVYGRNNDPNQSILIVATGEATSNNAALSGRGVGFLRSMDAGKTWELLDSATNVDAQGNRLTITDPARNHIFVGATMNRIIGDPTLTPAGGVILYAAVAGNANQQGLWRSVDSGSHWNRLRAGQATDVVLDPSSAAKDSFGNPTGNLRIVYAGFQGEGVFISPNEGQVWNQLNGGNGHGFIRDVGVNPTVAVPLTNPSDTPNGAKGRILLAKPALTGNALQDLAYGGWLYAVVANAGNNFDGLYMTKDFGANWTKVHIGNIGNTGGPQIPSSDINIGDFNIFNDGANALANIAMTFQVDPTNPNIVYIGGANRLIRVDTSVLMDAYAFVLSNNEQDGARSRSDTALLGGVTIKNLNAPQGATAGFTTYGQPGFITNTPGLPAPGNGGNINGAATINMVANPSDPFNANSSFGVNNVGRFNNSGTGATWTPFDGYITIGGRIEQMAVIKDPVTGRARLIVGTEQGVFTGVDGTGFSQKTSFAQVGTPEFTTTPGTPGTLGTMVIPRGDRTGNLQLAQNNFGAVQPSQAAADANFVEQAMFFGSTGLNGFPASNLNIINTGAAGNGTIVWPSNGPADDNLGSAGGVAVDPTGGGDVFRYIFPGSVPQGANFFQVNGVGRVFGLIQAGDDPGATNPAGQWVNTNINFAINPVDADQIIISSNVGRLFLTTTRGQVWNEVGNPGALGNSKSLAQAFGAPLPSDPVGSTNSFFYVGNEAGQIFVTFTAGGGNGNNFTNISNGLDGSPINAILANPNRGSREAYAVTDRGVFRMRDSGVANPVWQNITGNLFTIKHNSFGDPGLSENQLRILDSIAADWRYRIPDDINNPSGPSHPVLYAAGEGGVYRSLNNGTTWSIFPDTTTDGAPVLGGYLPNAHVVDLDLALGNINPDTGQPIVSTGTDLLTASTYGRGTFAIRIAPVVVPNTVKFDPSSDTGTSSVDRISADSSFIVSGYSENTGFGNTVRVSIVDLTDPNNPVIIGGFDPDDPSTDNSTNYTDVFGHFSVQAKANAFITNGTKVIGIRATDDAGVVGEPTKFNFVFDTQAPFVTAKNVSATEGSSFNGAVATFTDLSGGGLITIDWGDGQTSSGIPVDNGAGGFDVIGSHVYTEESPIGNPFQIKTTITDIAGNAAPEVIGSVTVLDPAVVVTGKAFGAQLNVQTPSTLVATFTDPGGPEAITDYDVTIDWGDGTPVTTHATIQPNGATLNVVGQHTYTTLGTFTTTITVTHDTAAAASAQGTATVALAPVTATGGFVISAVEGATFGSQTVATFTDPSGPGPLSNYSATIDWGDGSTSAGTITVNAGVFSVAGGHKYTEEGPYTIVTTINKVSALPATATSSANVSDPAVVATGGFTFIASQNTQSLTQTVATFIDPGGPEALVDYSASISWGDSTSSVGLISFNAGTGVFTVTGSHTYTQQGPFNITTTIHHDVAPDATAISSVNVTAAPVNATGNFTVAGLQGVPINNATVATFTDGPNPGAPGIYSASINWGDGGITTGTITYDAISNVFTVTGAHTYSQPGNYQIGVTITKPQAPNVTVNSTAIIAEPAVQITGGFNFTAPAGTATTHTVATFVDPAGAKPINTYSASINWGDSSTSTGSITFNAQTGVFTVSGTHAYAAQGTFTITVTVSHGSAPNASTTDIATIVHPALLITGGFTVNGVEGAVSALQAVATFSDPLGTDAIGTYSALINWGDSSSSAGVITVDPITRIFTVSGSHKYVEEGNFVISTTAHHSNATDVSATSNAVVTDPAVLATGVNFSAALSSNNTVTVATFNDPGGAEQLADYSATINWGDGASTNGTITFSAATQTFSVTGVHPYASSGTFTVTTTIHHDTAPNAVATSTATIGSLLNVTGGPSINAVTGVSTGGKVVATFTDPAGAGALNLYSASVNFGDNTAAVLGTITLNAQTGVFTVTASHTYNALGNFTVTTGVSKSGGPASTATTTATVTKPAVVVSGVAVSTTINSNATVNVATFTDPAGADVVGNYSASINWGDGTVTAGSISFNAITNTFTVAGSHPYANAGNFTITTTVHHGTAPDGVGNSIATVSGPLTVSGGPPINAVRTVSTGPKVVATFTDPAGAGNVNLYSASVNFGDGTAPVAGTISLNVQTGVFTVTAAHTYSNLGSFTVTTSVNKSGGPASSATTSAVVTNAPVIATGVNVSTTEGSAATFTVATFTDPSGAEPVGNYSASINWGDGAITAGSITFNAGTGVFSVSGAHPYATPGSFALITTINHGNAPAVAANGTASIAPSVPVVTGGITINAATFISTGQVAVATFTDPGGPDPINLYSATVNFGDGTNIVPGVITLDAQSGIYTVSAAHTYTSLGNFVITISVTKSNGVPQTATSGAIVTKPAVIATGINVNATSGTPLTANVATFTDPGGAEPIANYSASIDWGDGTSPSGGTITFNSVTKVFTVNGAHTYAAGGSFTVTTTIHHGTAPDGIATSTATVASVIVLTGGFTINAVAAVPTGSQAVATFTDMGGAGAPNAYTATVSFGDGTAAVAGVITLDVPTGVFTVSAGHTYAHFGNFNITVTVTKTGGTPQVTTSTASVTDGVINVTGRSLHSNEASPFSGLVATFTSANAGATIGIFTATIDWGDGSAPTAGTISVDPTPGVFDVSGAHTYGDGVATHSIHVTVQSNGGSMNSDDSSIAVANLPPSAQISGPSKGSSGIPLTINLGATDPSSADQSAGFDYLIDWGDGTSQGVAASAGNGSGLTADHTFTAQGSRHITLTATDKDGDVSAVTAIDVTIGPPAPEVQAFQVTSSGDVERQSGQKPAVSFGNVTVGHAGSIRTFKIKNAGSATMSISSLKVPTGFKVIQGLVSSLAKGKSDTFQVQLVTTSVGLKSGSIKIVNTDPNEGTFTILVTGNVRAATKTATRTRRVADETQLSSSGQSFVTDSTAPRSSIVRDGDRDLLA